MFQNRLEHRKGMDHHKNFIEISNFHTAFKCRRVHLNNFDLEFGKKARLMIVNDFRIILRGTDKEFLF